MFFRLIACLILLAAVNGVALNTKQLETRLLSVLNSPTLVINDLKNTVAELEKNRGIIKPCASPVLDGCWRLLYVGNDVVENASPIQRTVTSLKQVKIFQVVHVKNRSTSFLKNGTEPLPDVSNTVCFGDFRLRVTALASTKDSPLVIPRVGDGRIFGLNIFGVSSSKPPRDADERIDFAFKEALFECRKEPLTKLAIPYPVPFTLLGDEAKGWIDVTYLSDTLRLSRGNKGSLFILQKADTALDPDARWAATNLKTNTVTPSSVPRAAPVSTSASASSSNPFAFLTSLGRKPTKKPRAKVAIILPAQLATEKDYEPLQTSLRADYGIDSVAVPLVFPDWILGLLPSFLTKEYLDGTLQPAVTLKFYLQKVDEAVRLASDKYGDDAELVLIGHSIGGWIARAWLSEWATPAVRARVASLVTLGSPHQPPPAESLFSSSDQTRGMLSYINKNYPGAFEKSVRYISVIGSGVEGKVEPNIASLVAYASYAVLCGKGDSLGDGVIPVATAALPGAALVEIKGSKHSNFIPAPFGSIKIDSLAWYGSSAPLGQWAAKL